MLQKGHSVGISECLDRKRSDRMGKSLGRRGKGEGGGDEMDWSWKSMACRCRDGRPLGPSLSCQPSDNKPRLWQIAGRVHRGERQQPITETHGRDGRIGGCM
jgi:hypothetical protein